MARAASPFYYGNDPAIGASIGQSLGRALFGDPQLAQQLALRKAQMAEYAAQAQEATSHAGLYDEQTTGEHTKNTAAAGLPGFIQSLFPHTQPSAPAPAPTGPVDPLAPLPDAQPAAGAVSFDPQTFRNGLPAAVAAMMQAQGDKLDPNKGIGLLSAMMGNDEFARRGMVGQGVTPGKEFALTPERADDIANTGYTADFNKGTAEARINHASDIPVANIQAATSRRGQDVSASTSRRGQDLEHSDRVYGIQVKEGADIANPAGGNVIARALGPGAVITSNARTPQEQRDVYATQHPGVAPVMNSAHLDAADGYPAFDVRPVPGQTFEQAKQAVAAQAAQQGGYLRFAQDEGTHWHFDVRGVKSSTRPDGSAKAPKEVNAAAQKMITDEITTQLEARGLAGQPDPGTMANIRNGAIYRYQQTGNPVGAVSATLDQLQRAAAAKKGGGSAQASAGPKQLRDQALAAISKGADPAAVKARFKKMTGQELVGA